MMNKLWRVIINYLSNKNMELQMFLDDFCVGYSFGGSLAKIGRNYYSVKYLYNNDNERETLFFEDITRDDYKFDQLMGWVTQDLIVFGESLVYIKISDENNRDEITKHICFKRLSCSGVTPYNRQNTISDNLEKSNIIQFKVQKTGIKRFTLLMFLYGLYKVNKRENIWHTIAIRQITNPINWLNSCRFKSDTDVLRLKVAKHIPYSYRGKHNDHLSDSYLLYRVIKFKKLRLKILKYILETINNKLLELKGKLGCNATIEVIPVDMARYDKAWEDYTNGKINTNQLSDIVWNKISY